MTALNPTFVDWLNAECFCVGLDRARLEATLALRADDPDFVANHVARREHLFSAAPVYAARADLDRMARIVAAIERAATLPGYRAQALARARPEAAEDRGPAGAFMGYDFHLGPEGPRLIEINTNAGGAFLAAALAEAHRPCCPDVAAAFAQAGPEAFEAAVAAMFAREWRAQGRVGRPGLIAIVDDAPETQYLYPEFLLAQRLFARHGLAARIVDACDLVFRDGALFAGADRIDLVYNRLTDFALAAPEHAALSAAWASGAAVVTPGPRHHALFADKRNLIALSDQALLESWGLAGDDAALIAAAALRTRSTTPENAAELWRLRKRLFFKPADGHAGKAVYRGDKLTRSVWDAVVAQGHLAQDLAAPATRAVRLDGAVLECKSDIRLYAYAGEALMATARVYAGQTTNFRTPGGGFAPVAVA